MKFLLILVVCAPDCGPPLGVEVVHGTYTECMKHGLPAARRLGLDLFYHRCLTPEQAVKLTNMRWL